MIESKAAINLLRQCGFFGPPENQKTPGERPKPVATCAVQPGIADASPPSPPRQRYR